MSANPLRADPTQLATLRRVFYGDVKRRYARLQAAIERVLSDENGLQFNWQFLAPPERVRAFERWLALQLDATILDSDNDPRTDPWYVDYIAQAYERGAARAYDQVRKAALVPPAAHAAGKAEFLRQLLARQSATPTTNAAPQRDAAGKFISEKARILSLRLENELRGCTKQAAQNLARELIKGIEAGYKPRTIAIAMRKTTTIEARRALVVARTELTRAHAEGTLDALESLGVKQVGLEAEWRVGGNACPQCSRMAGRTMSVAEARGMIPLHPNCMCAWTTVAVQRGKNLPHRRET